MQENEKNQHSGSITQDAHPSKAFGAAEPEEQGSYNSSTESSQDQPAAMSSNFYTDELAMQAADERTETIGESAAAGTEPEKSTSDVRIPYSGHS